MATRPSERDCGVSGAGSSEIAAAFGAKVTVPVRGRSLFYVVGRVGPPDAILGSVGGSVVTRLPDPRRVLAIAPLEALERLRRHPDLALAGPVGIDPQRFGSFARMIGLDEERAPAPRPP